MSFFSHIIHAMPFLFVIILTLPNNLHVIAADPANTKQLQIAETILVYQRSNGGWPKNYDRAKKLSNRQKEAVRKDHDKNDTMIDNGATHQEIRLLAKAYLASGDPRFSKAANRGIAYLLAGQYRNGGWPQRFPKPQGYARYITFNDDAMIGTMTLLRNIYQQPKLYPFVSREVRGQCRDSVQRGIQCILQCQIRVNGKLTAWCAQHDQVNFQPRKARSYELASLSGHESVGIIRFLMEIERPTPQVTRAIEQAVDWLDRVKLEGIKLITVEDRSKPGGKDRILIQDRDAPPLWARFYDIQTNTPIFCSRDGIPRKTLAEISHERRNGYSWLGAFARDLFARDLPAWKQRQAQARKER